MSPLGNRKPLSTDKALERLETQCAAAEMSTGEAMQKLHRWGIGQDEARRIVESLVGRRFINDRRFAGAFARDKFQFSGWGRIKIAMHLSNKGVDRSTIEQALESIDPERYRSALQQMIDREFDRNEEEYSDFAGRQKLARRYIGRGFEPSAVIEAIKKKAAAKHR